jgi:uncharacterized protein with ParB-like and HNH nuclease domain
MNVTGAPLQSFLEGKKQYVVPLFQRSYTWKKERWSDLWEDLMGLYYSPESREHFIGSIVTLPLETNPAGVLKSLLIDGQQRITTLLLLLSAIRDLAKQTESVQNLAQDIDESYLNNKFVSNEEDRYKALPTELDRDEFASAMRGEPLTNAHRIHQCKRWFLETLLKGDEEGKAFDLPRLRNQVVSRLALVSISLAKDENPYLIFETLNARGTPLTQGDLIRNFVFMNIKDEKQQQNVYKGTWLPMEMELGDGLTNFLRHFLLMEGGEIRSREVYVTTKERYSGKTSEQFVQLIDQLSTHASYYEKLLDPSKEGEVSLNSRLERLRDWDVTTAYPLLLRLYEYHATGELTTGDFVKALSLIESYLVRRVVLNYSGRSLNRYFPAISKSIDKHNVLGSMSEGLKAYGWPEDGVFGQALRTNPLYFGSGVRNILFRLEESYHHKEPANLDNVSVEHIMPQTLNDDWMKELGDSYDEIHQTWLHTLGNLTLSAYNPELSNKSFAEKKETYNASNLELNKYVSKFNKWNQDSIQQRAQVLADRAVNVWPRPD